RLIEREQLSHMPAKILRCRIAEFLSQNLIELPFEDLFCLTSMKVGRLADRFAHRAEHLAAKRLPNEILERLLQLRLIRSCLVQSLRLLQTFRLMQLLERCRGLE